MHREDKLSHSALLFKNTSLTAEIERRQHTHLHGYSAIGIINVQRSRCQGLEMQTDVYPRSVYRILIPVQCHGASRQLGDISRRASPYCGTDDTVRGYSPQPRSTASRLVRLGIAGCLDEPSARRRTPRGWLLT